MTDSDRFLPHTTVATVLEKDGKFLLVEEFSQGRRVLNQPAGHLEPKESPSSMTLMASATSDTALQGRRWNLTPRLSATRVLLQRIG